MLDQKLIRENPTFVEDNLSLRGKVYNINFIHKLSIERKEIDIIKDVYELVPLSLTAKEQIDFLKEWSSTGRARSAS